MSCDYIECGDCLEKMKSIPDGSVDMILSDLPYGTTSNKWDSVIPLDAIWANYERVIKGNGAIVLFSQQPFSGVLCASNPKMLRYEWIWEKSCATGFLNAKKAPLKAHENIIVFYKKPPTYNPQGLVKLEKPIFQKGTYHGTNYGDASKDSVREYGNYPRDVLRFASEGKTLHPTQKPVALLEYLIRTYTNEGDTVLDNCMGSGSTCVAAVNTGRHYIGIEKEPKYFEIAEKRISDAKKKLSHEEDNT